MKALDKGELTQHALQHIPGHVRSSSNQFRVNANVMKWVCVVAADAGEKNATLMEKLMQPLSIRVCN